MRRCFEDQRLSCGYRATDVACTPGHTRVTETIWQKDSSFRVKILQAKAVPQAHGDI